MYPTTKSSYANLLFPSPVLLDDRRNDDDEVKKVTFKIQNQVGH